MQIPMDITALSGIAGSISIACWIVVFSPQIIENFRRSSAEGLSIIFVIIWLVGDVFNILGAVLQGVLPTMTILAVYYTLADIVLLAQCFYYRGFTFTDEIKQKRPSEAPASERSALLHDNHDTVNDSQSATSLPGDSYSGSRRSSSTIREHIANLDGTRLSPATPLHGSQDRPLPPGRAPREEKWSILQAVFINLTAILLVCAAGILGWYLSIMRTARIANHHRHHHYGDVTPLHFDFLGQLFGYICAILYLGSRVPQLLLNHRRKSTEGVSMLFFLFACIGNATYVLSILAYQPSCQRRHDDCRSGETAKDYGRYLLINLSWLIGSFGTLLLDFMVFIQYFWYKDRLSNEPIVPG